VRLFSPEYCRGKKIRPYEEELLSGLRFPLTRDIVRKQLGKPARTRKIPCFDEYLSDGCRIRFEYRGKESDVVFVELEWDQGGS
jgi:hypothetical protein